MTDEKEMQPTIIGKLQERGITMDDMIESALTLYTPHEGTDSDKTIEEIGRKLEKMINSQCVDLNVQTLIVAAICLEKEIENGVLKINGDPVNLLADELIGIALAEYIGGKKGLFNFIRYDQKKPGILSKLGAFLDDAVGGLIAGCMTRLFEDWK